MIPQLIVLSARLVCHFRGHKRGKRAPTTGERGLVNTGHALFFCLRCGKTWTRKDRKAKTKEIRSD